MTITDEMVEAAADVLVCHGEFNSMPARNHEGATVAARAALTAALTQSPVGEKGGQEPVAWRYRYKDAAMSSGSNRWVLANQNPALSRTKLWREIREIEPLYPSPAQGQREGGRTVLVILNGREVKLSGLALEVMEAMDKGILEGNKAAFNRGREGALRFARGICEEGDVDHVKRRLDAALTSHKEGDNG